MLIAIRGFCKGKGQGIVEYAVLLAFVVLVAAYIFSSDGLMNAVKGTFSSVASAINS